MLVECTLLIRIDFLNAFITHDIYLVLYDKYDICISLYKIIQGSYLDTIYEYHEIYD